MTATYETPTRVVTEREVAPAHDRPAARREALTAVDSFVRPLLRTLRLPFAFGRPSTELTAYDQIYRRTSAGGHWTVFGRQIGLLSHTVAGYTVTLHFDADDRPSHFLVAGARETITADATPEALARGLDAAVRGGPLLTWAPSFPPGISL